MTRFTLSLVFLLAALLGYADRSYLCFDSIVADGVARFALPDVKAKKLIVEARSSLIGERERAGESRQCRGLEFDNGLSITLRSGNTAYGDAADTRYVRLTVCHGDSTLLDRRFDKHLTADAGRAVSIVTTFLPNGRLEVFGGEGVPELLFSTIFYEEFPKEVAVTAQGKLRLEGLVAEWEPNRADMIQTDWTVESLSRRFAVSRDPIEGFWTYFDRENDPLFARPGGRYTLACVADETGNGYTLIYVDGAQVNASQWTPGMMKGRLMPTAFRDQYNLEWFDAEMLSISGDIHARIEQNALMTLEFPLLKTILRLSKAPRP